MRSAVARISGKAAAAKPESLPDDLAHAGVPPLLVASNGPPPDFAVRTDGKRIFALLVNATDAPSEFDVALPQRGSITRWSAWTGAITPQPAAAGGRTALHVSLPAYGSALYVIDPGSAPLLGSAPASDMQEIGTLGQSGWKIAAHGFTAAAQAVDTNFSLNHLVDWRTIPDLGAFSGHAVYQTELQASETTGHVLLDLGDVRGAARITLNGCSAGTVMAPYRVDITAALHSGQNTLAVTIGSTPLNGESHR